MLTFDKIFPILKASGGVPSETESPAAEEEDEEASEMEYTEDELWDDGRGSLWWQDEEEEKR